MVMELCIRNPGGSIPNTDVFAGVDNAAAPCNGAWEEVSHRAEGIRLGIACAVFFGKNTLWLECYSLP
ncbi:hypothetical protein CR161_11505 [Prosthecochloris sp. ZM]|nr:hypothetical protein CR161_11505 [Prosthecochloris sp. ZM]